MSTQQTSPRHDDEDPLERAWDTALEFFEENWLHVLLAVAVVIAGVVGWRVYRLRRQTHENTAWNLLGSLPPGSFRRLTRGPEAEEVVREAILKLEQQVEAGPNTTARPWAMLQLAALKADTGQWDAAVSIYARLDAEYGDSPAALPAKTGWAAALENLERYEDAARAYEQAAKAGLPMYFLSAARCRELAEQPQEAERLYRRYLDSEASSDERRLAQARLQAVRQGELLKPAPEVPESPAALRPAAPEGPPVPPTQEPVPLQPGVPEQDEPPAEAPDQPAD